MAVSVAAGLVAGGRAALLGAAAGAGVSALSPAIGQTPTPSSPSVAVSAGTTPDHVEGAGLWSVSGRLSDDGVGRCESTRPLADGGMLSYAAVSRAEDATRPGTAMTVTGFVLRVAPRDPAEAGGGERRPASAGAVVRADGQAVPGSRVFVGDGQIEVHLTTEAAVRPVTTALMSGRRIAVSAEGGAARADFAVRGYAEVAAAIERCVLKLGEARNARLLEAMGHRAPPAPAAQPWDVEGVWLRLPDGARVAACVAGRPGRDGGVFTMSLAAVLPPRGNGVAGGRAGDPVEVIPLTLQANSPIGAPPAPRDSAEERPGARVGAALAVDGRRIRVGEGEIRNGMLVVRLADPSVERRLREMGDRASEVSLGAEGDPRPVRASIEGVGAALWMLSNCVGTMARQAALAP